MAAAVAEDHLAALEAKLDAVSQQLDFVAAALREQELRRGIWDELRRDLAPVTAEALQLVSRELDEVRGFITPEDLFRLVKRLLRDLPYLEALLDQVESLSALGADLSPLGRDILAAAMVRLDDLEQRGYFAFLGAMKELADRVVAALTPDDLRAMGESVAPAVHALKDLAHPDVMRLLAGVAVRLREAPPEDKGLIRLLWQLRRPGARRGLSRALGLLEALGDADRPDPVS
ncbi:MAG: hypothetical protein FJW79_03915 [Actinobacteria bacterium]|nr:hypothetical protein [Actinomycetota bacterium]